MKPLTCGFSFTYWMLCLLMMMNFAIFSPFYDNGNDLLVHRAHVTQGEAGFILFLPILVSCVVTVFLEGPLSRVPQQRNLIILMSTLYILTFAVLLALPSHKTGLTYALCYGAMLLLGSSTGLLNILESNAVTKIIDQARLG